MYDVHIHVTSPLYHVIDRTLYLWVMATVQKGLSDRQKRCIRASIAKRLVECGKESLRKTSAPPTADSQTVTGCENDLCVDYKSEDDDRLLPSSDDSDQPSIEDDGTISPDFEGYDPVAVLSESSDNLTTPDDSTDSADSESLSSMDLLDESMSLSELSSGEENELELNQLTRKALFPGGQFSNHEFCVALLSIFQKHSLTYSAVDDLLQLFCCVLPPPSILTTS